MFSLDLLLLLGSQLGENNIVPSLFIQVYFCGLLTAGTLVEEVVVVANISHTGEVVEDGGVG